MEEQNTLKRKTWWVRAVPHSTHVLFLREERNIYCKLAKN
jgi:hypothetical protein